MKSCSFGDGLIMAITLAVLVAPADGRRQCSFGSFHAPITSSRLFDIAYVYPTEFVAA